jgi:hypothetical protein
MGPAAPSSNLPGGVLQGGIAIVAGASSAVSVSNGGTITGGTFGISLHDVGSVTNTAGAVILGAKSAPVGTAYAAIYLGNGGTVSNAGSIYGELGIEAHGNASIANSASATISGVFVSCGVGTLANAGYIGGVSLYDGGTVTNQVSGTIFLTNLGGPTESVINYGTLDNRRGGTALYMSGSGSLSNAASGLITNIFMENDASVSNAGTITGRLIVGYYSFLSNIAGATISSVDISSGTFDNAGVIDGTLGIRFHFGGLVSNASSGTIAGTFGVAMYTGTNAAQYGTVINAGTITGNSGAAVRFPNGHGVLVVDPGARFNGMVDGVTAASSALELGTGNGGTLAGFGTSIVNFGSITFDTGAEWTIAGNTSRLSGVISGFAQVDTIDLTGSAKLCRITLPAH